jgi:hypothetical protein
MHDCKWFRTVHSAAGKDPHREGEGEEDTTVHTHTLTSPLTAFCLFQGATHIYHHTTDDTILLASMSFLFCFHVSPLPLLFNLMFPETTYHHLLPECCCKGAGPASGRVSFWKT